MSGESPDKHRVTVTLEFSTQAVSALAKIMRRNTYMSLSETIEEALLFQYALQSTVATGGEVIIRQENGDEFSLESEGPAPRPSA